MKTDLKLLNIAIVIWLLIFGAISLVQSDQTIEQGVKVYCVSEIAGKQEILTENGKTNQYGLDADGKGLFTSEPFCGMNVQYARFNYSNDPHGQWFIHRLVEACQKLDPIYKWVQPHWDDKYWYLFKIGDVFYGRIWQMGMAKDNYGYNNHWKEEGGGFLKETWERKNCDLMNIVT